jgi:hypothetical protein
LQAAVRQPEPIVSHKCLADATSGVGSFGMVNSSPFAFLPLRDIPVSTPHDEIKGDCECQAKSHPPCQPKIHPPFRAKTIGIE